MLSGLNALATVSAGGLRRRLRRVDSGVALLRIFGFGGGRDEVLGVVALLGFALERRLVMGDGGFSREDGGVGIATALWSW